MNNIETLNHRYQVLFNDYQANRIDEAAFITEVDKLQFQDEWGRYWMIGAQTGAWHYFDGQNWHQADPNEADKLPIMDENGLYWQRGVKSGEWYYYNPSTGDWTKPDANMALPTQQSSPVADQTEDIMPGFDGELFQDAEGRYWTVGTKTGQWYFYDQNGWHAADELQNSGNVTQPPYNAQPYQPTQSNYMAQPQPAQPYITPQYGQDPQYSQDPQYGSIMTNQVPQQTVVSPSTAVAPITQQEQQTVVPQEPITPTPLPQEEDIRPRVANNQSESVAVEQPSTPPPPPTGGLYFFDGKNWMPYTAKNEAETVTPEGTATQEPTVELVDSATKAEPEIEVIDVEVVAVVEPEPEPQPKEKAVDEPQQPLPPVPYTSPTIQKIEETTSITEWESPHQKSNSSVSGVPLEEDVRPRQATQRVNSKNESMVDAQPRPRRSRKQSRPHPTQSRPHSTRSREAVVIPTGADPSTISVRPSRPVSRPMPAVSRPAANRQRRVRDTTMPMGANRTNTATHHEVTQNIPTTAPQPARRDTDQYNVVQQPAQQSVTKPATQPNVPVQSEAPTKSGLGGALQGFSPTMWSALIGIVLSILACVILTFSGSLINLAGFGGSAGSLISSQPTETPTLDIDKIPGVSPTPAPTNTPIQPTVTPTASGLTKIANPDLGISLKYPQNWQTTEDSTSLTMAPAEEGLATDQTTIPVMRIGQSADSTDDAALLADLLAQFPLDAQELNKASIGIGGETWTSVQIQYEAKTDDGSTQETVATLAVMATDTGGYYLSAIAPSNEWNQLQPIYQGMINSFEFLSEEEALAESQEVPTITPTATTEAEDETDEVTSDEELSDETATPKATPTKKSTATPTNTPEATPTDEATATPTATPTDEATPTPTSTPAPLIYEIESGDTLSRIAAKFDVDMDLLADVNGIDIENDTLQIGDELLIPLIGDELAELNDTSSDQPTPSAEDEDETETGETPTAEEEEDSSADEEEVDSSPTDEEEESTTPEETEDSEPAQISGRIVYPAFDPGPGVYNIWLADLATNEQEIIAAEASQPAFSKDGSILVYRSWDIKSRGILFRDYVSGDGGAVTKFVEDSLPVWNPDGFTFVFSSRREGDRQPRLYSGNPSTKTDSGIPFEGVYPSVFPDGRVVARGCLPGGIDCGLYVMAATAGNPVRIGTTSDTAPAASPTSNKIAFMSNGRGATSWEIWVMDADGSNPTRLTENGSDDGLPTWSPDGKSIAFASNQGGVWAIWVMNADGSNQRQLVAMKGSPNGTVLNDTGNSFGWWEERISWAP